MHNTVRRWSARRSYVLLAFILIIIVLILAGCASLNHVQEGNGTLTAGSATDVDGDIVDAGSSGSLARPSSASGKGLT